MFLLTLLILLSLQHALMTPNSSTLADNPCITLQDSIYYGGRCLMLFELNLTWMKAKNYCERFTLGGRLAELITEKERLAVTSFINKTAWVALRNINNQYRWAYSSIEEKDTFSFQSLKNLTNTNNETCVHLNESRLELADCDSMNYYLCETEINDQEPVTDPCYPMGNADYLNGTCAQYFNVMVPWLTAQKQCSLLGARLSEMTTDSQRYKLLSYLYKYKTQRDFSLVWLGGMKFGNSSDFTWLSHSNQTVSQSVWDLNYPVNNLEKACVKLTSFGYLRNEECNRTELVLCKTDYGSFHISNDNETMDWENAKIYCSTKNWTLAEIEFSKEILDVLRFEKDMWVDARNRDGVFIWSSSNSTLRKNWLTYDMISSNMTNNTKMCLAVDNGWLFDDDCSNTHTFVCELEKEDPCSTMYNSWYIQRFCFTLYLNKTTWEDAKSLCLSKDSHLAELTTPEVENALIDKIFNHTEDMTEVWIGGYGESGLYHWNTTRLDIEDTLVLNTSFPYIAWRKDGGNITLETRTSNSSNYFVCQSPATRLRVKNYVAVIPKTARYTKHINAELQITSGYTSLTVYLSIQQTCPTDCGDRGRYALLPGQYYVNSLKPFLQHSTEGVSSRYVTLRSSQPVTVLLFIWDQDDLTSGSTLVLPTDLYNKTTGLFYFLRSHLHEHTDQSITFVNMGSILANVSLKFKYLQNTYWDKKRDNAVYEYKQMFIINSSISKLTYTSLKQRYEDLTVNLYDVIGDLTILSNGPVAVFLSYMAYKVANNSGWIHEEDFTLDEFIPLDYAGSSYIGFPSVGAHDGGVYDAVYTLVSLNDNNNITVFGIDNDSVITVNLKEAGDIQIIKLNPGYFYYFNGTYTFTINVKHEHRTDDVRTTTNLSCVSSLVPDHLWRLQYDFYHSGVYTSVIYVIVKPTLTDKIVINGYNDDVTCVNITGTELSGCTMVITSNGSRHIHIYIRYHQSEFMAYVYSYSNSSSFCHPLGIGVKDLWSTIQYLNYSAVFEQYNNWDGVTETFSRACPTVSQAAATPRPTTTTIRPHQSVEEIKKELSVEKTDILSYRMTKECLPDFRPASNAVGALGIIIITTVVAIFCSSDVITVISFLYHWLKNTYSIITKPKVANEKIFTFRNTYA